MTESAEQIRYRNLLLRIAYDGTDFYGWQIQPERATIQGTLAEVLEQICGEKVPVCGSGRTDAGVHAGGQAANIKTSSPIPCPNLVKAMNRLLPESIRILSAQAVREDFHARYHAQSKLYRYRIFRGEICPPWLSRYVLPYPYPLDEAAMERAAKYFEGTYDFRSFAAADRDEDNEEQATASDTAVQVEKQSSIRTVFSSVLSRQGVELVYNIEGNGFLHHMVRNIVGTLIDIGRGRTKVEAVPEILGARQRSAAGPTAPARGLHLVSVCYPDDIGVAE
jgi:tRNA pseudouridine38-40 synthase